MTLVEIRKRFDAFESCPEDGRELRANRLAPTVCEACQQNHAGLCSQCGIVLADDVFALVGSVNCRPAEDGKISAGRSKATRDLRGQSGVVCDHQYWQNCRASRGHRW